MNFKLDIQTNNNLLNIHFKSLISFLTVNLLSVLIFDFYLNLWQCVTLYTGIYSSLVPLKFYLYRPFSIILFLIFFNTLRNSIVLSLLEILCLVLRIVNTSGEQCKQATRTQQKVTMITLKR